MVVLRIFAVLSFVATVLSAQPKRVLYITHSAGFKHDSIAASADAMKSIASATGKLDITVSEDVSLLSAATLRNYDAVFFFTSGELPISDSQKRDLLDFVRTGHGFGGAHSATDTFYSWPEYSDLIGAYFNGHPWVQEVKIDAEDSSHPASAAGAPWFTMLEEIYQFRNFNRANSRVLLRLDPSSVDLNAPEAIATRWTFHLPGYVLMEPGACSTPRSDTSMRHGETCDSRACCEARCSGLRGRKRATRRLGRCGAR